MKTIKVVIVPIGGNPFVNIISNDLKTQQNLVGGHLEGVTMEPGVHLICNEDGMALNLPFNRTVGPHQILGPFYITRSDSAGESIDLTPADIQKYLKMFGG